METLKKSAIQEAFAICSDYLALETHEYKLLEGEKLSTFLALYGLENTKSDIFYTNYNIIFTSLDDYDGLKFYIKKGKVLFKIELPEYDKYIISMEYFNDSSLPNVLK